MKYLNLKKKIIWKIKKVILIFISLLFLISILIYFFANEYFFFSSFILGLYFISFYLFLNKFLEKILDVNIFSRFNRILTEIKEIHETKKNSLTVDSTDELGELIHFTNQVLIDYQKALDVEKNNALIDPLTLCFNRRALESQFNGFKSKALRENFSIGFLLVDLDKFKDLNDTYGHDVGDEVLKFFVTSLKTFLREYDYLYRLGGEEFLIIFSEADSSKYKKINNRLLHAVPELFSAKFPKIKREITFSGGFSQYNFSNNKNKNLTFEKVFKEIDSKLYEAKKLGRNKIIA